MRAPSVLSICSCFMLRNQRAGLQVCYVTKHAGLKTCWVAKQAGLQIYWCIEQNGTAKIMGNKQNGIANTPKVYTRHWVPYKWGCQNNWIVLRVRSPDQSEAARPQKYSPLMAPSLDTTNHGLTYCGYPNYEQIMDTQTHINKT